MIRSLVLAALIAAPTLAQDSVEDARAILADQPIFDGHNDLPYAIRSMNGSRISDFPYGALDARFAERMATDGAKMQAGGVGAQFWSVYVPASLPEAEAVVQVLEQIDLTDRLIAANSDMMEKASTAADVRRIMKTGKVAGMYGIEGGHGIANSLGTLRQMYDRGVRYMTLTHSASIAWADSATDDPRADGLSAFGKEVVREMNRLGMLVDLSHVSQKTMADALDVTEAPVIFSHSSARAITGHLRNVPDEILTRVKDNGGVVMVTFVESFLSEKVRMRGAAYAAEQGRLGALYSGRTALVEAGLEEWAAANPQPKATVQDAADHIDHIRKIAGIDHIGIGGDFDGIPTYPTGLEDVSAYPNLFAELLKRGYSAEDLKKISSGNVLRALEAAETVAARLQSERGPSEMLFAAEKSE
ncbi:dipeptidase [Pacificimonas sp. WHA3]|uniref:Dipeptidase n=1 Tax=Pacificimonas pallii TaxID=2827236 RepID=A0ABS6SCH2_9SPHN|nr:dipeptidase [Pacificimonas pallii]MBV7255616.1 dipeptidase [Pacificimonas pallii]